MRLRNAFENIVSEASELVSTKTLLLKHYYRRQGFCQLPWDNPGKRPKFRKSAFPRENAQNLRRTRFCRFIEGGVGGEVLFGSWLVSGGSPHARVSDRWPQMRRSRHVHVMLKSTLVQHPHFLGLQIVRIPIRPPTPTVRLSIRS